MSEGNALLAPDAFLDAPDARYVIEIHDTAIPLSERDDPGWRTERRVYLVETPFYRHDRLCEFLRQGTIDDDPVRDAQQVGSLLLSCDPDQVPVRRFCYRNNGHGQTPRVDEAVFRRTLQRGTPESRLDRVKTIQYLSVAEAAERLDLTESAVRQAIRAGRLRAMKVGWAWIVDERDLRFFQRGAGGYRKGRQRKGAGDGPKA